MIDRLGIYDVYRLQSNPILGDFRVVVIVWFRLTVFMLDLLC